MDIGLGDDMDGYEVTQHIRNQPGKNQNTPIIALTAHADEESKKQCITAGINEVYNKPLTQACAMELLKTFTLAPHTKSPPEAKTTRFDLPDTNQELFQLEQFPLLDSQQALKNCGNNKKTLMDMLTLMSAQELPSCLEQMKKAYVKKNYSQVEQLAHKIKGSAVYAGTARMKYACQYVERYWKTGERQLFDALYHQAVTTIEDTLFFIKEWVKNNPTG